MPVKSILRMVLLALCLFGIVRTANAAAIVARISLATQTMSVFENGRFLYQWRVSTARRGYHTPLGVYRPIWLSRYHRSNKYDDAPMPFAIFFKGGYAVHGTDMVRHLGRPASHGCVRLHPANAALLFDMVRSNGLGNTRIVVRRR